MKLHLLPCMLLFQAYFMDKQCSSWYENIVIQRVRELQNTKSCLMYLWELFLSLSYSTLDGFWLSLPQSCMFRHYFPPGSTSPGYNWETYANYVHIANKKVQVTFFFTGNRFELGVFVVGWLEFWGVYICLLWFWFCFQLEAVLTYITCMILHI